jgi:hypothetical protein
LGVGHDDHLHCHHDEIRTQYIARVFADVARFWT